MITITEAKRQAVGNVVKELDVVVTTAGAPEQVDKTLPKKQSKQEWTQKLGLTDITGHIWAIVSNGSFNPVVKQNNLLIQQATIDEFTNKGGDQEKRLLIKATDFKIDTVIGEPPPGGGYGEKSKFEGVLDPLVEKILAKYDISVMDALWPCTRTHKKITKTNWVIYHRYCEQIAAKAGIVFELPQVIVNTTDDKGHREVVLLVIGQMGHVKEWSYGEASPATTFLPYVFAIAEKRAKDRVILKLAGFHGMVYSDVEEDWKNDKAKE